jgi:hypothetical protein
MGNTGHVVQPPLNRLLAGFGLQFWGSGFEGFMSPHVSCLLAGFGLSNVGIDVTGFMSGLCWRLSLEAQIMLSLSLSLSPLLLLLSPSLLQAQERRV